MAYTTANQSCSSNGERSDRDRWGFTLGTAVAAPSIYPNVPDKADVILTGGWQDTYPAGASEVAIQVAGPAASVEFALGGLILDGQVVDLTIVRTTAANFVAQYIASGDTTSIDVAETLSLLIDAEVDMSSVAVDGKITATADSPVTALQVTVFTIT